MSKLHLSWNISFRFNRWVISLEQLWGLLFLSVWSFSYSKRKYLCLCNNPPTLHGWTTFIYNCSDTDGQTVKTCTPTRTVNLHQHTLTLIQHLLLCGPTSEKESLFGLNRAKFISDNSLKWLLLMTRAGRAVGGTEVILKASASGGLGGLWCNVLITVSFV